MSDATVSVLEVLCVEVSAKTTWIFVRLIGADGAEGLGEATLNDRTQEVLAAIPAAVGAVTASCASHAARTQAAAAHVPGVVGRAIASALEQAWLDREGERRGQPVFALLGGRRREAVPVYANINRGTLTRSPEDFADRAALAVASGYGAVKLAPFDGVSPDAPDGSERDGLIEAGLARIAAVVQRVGRTARVQVDCHSRLRIDELVHLAERVAAAGAVWLEEPVRETPAALAALARLRPRARALGLVVAGAENVPNLGDLAPFCVAGAYDVVMPDIVLAGGPSEAVRMGHLAAALGSAVSLHNPCGPVMDAHSAHVAAALPALHSLERQFAETPLYDELVIGGHAFAQGALTLAGAPGLGLRLRRDRPEIRPVARFDIGL
jgi:galactonate dehydratase